MQPLMPNVPLELWEETKKYQWFTKSSCGRWDALWDIVTYQFCCVVEEAFSLSINLVEMWDICICIDIDSKFMTINFTIHVTFIRFPSPFDIKYNSMFWQELDTPRYFEFKCPTNITHQRQVITGSLRVPFCFFKWPNETISSRGSMFLLSAYLDVRKASPSPYIRVLGRRLVSFHPYFDTIDINI